MPDRVLAASRRHCGSSTPAPVTYDPSRTPATAGVESASSLILDGPPGREGFIFHDGHNQRVHQAAPGLLGLLEARHVIASWKPQILGWLDQTEHFFNHIFAEFEGEPAFDPLRRELRDIRDLDAPLPVRNRFLFHYLTAATRGLERQVLFLEKALTGDVRLRLNIAEAPSTLSLNGTWNAHYRQLDGWHVDREMVLPVNWELLPAIDNYAGTMRFTRTFALDDEAQGRRVLLHFHGVDYFASLWVNGHHVGEHEGYFAPFEFDITPFVRYRDDNIVRLTVTSPIEPSGTGTHVTSGWHDFSPASSFPNRKTLVKGTLGHHDARRGGAWSCLTSQDGNTGGVWNDVELRVVNPVHFAPNTPRLTTGAATLVPGAAAHTVSVKIAFEVRNTTERDVAGRLWVLLQPANFKGVSHELVKEVTLAPGSNAVAFEERLDPVRLWQPRDRGFPSLYTVTSTIEVDDAPQDTSVVETGFRVLSVSPLGESEGPEGAFVVNGSPVFVRGTNLLPTYWMSEYTPERIEQDFLMLTEAGFNSVLIHNLVLPKRFYQQANRNGFLVVQMFPLQWTYEQSEHFAIRASAQIVDMAALLANEPSVVSYETHNEPDMRTFENLDNRFLDFDLHARLRQADPSRWATTYSSGNHAYPGQFYPLRDDNSFATLPARFLEDEFAGRRISRHRNMPTEFGIQAMPHTELFCELLSEDRVKAVLARIRTDRKWLAAGAETYEEAEKTIEEAKALLGGGTWAQTLQCFDWAVLWELGELVDRIRHIESSGPDPDSDAQKELLSLKAALLVLEVLHYGGFKGENFWFGLWRPGHGLEDFVASSQDRQYRLHKDSIENYLNAGATGPIVGYFSFMFRDADWEAPTWGVVDAAWVPKKAYRAYLESNQAVRVTLPHALRTPVKLPGDRWCTIADAERACLAEQPPWVGSDVILANDTTRSFPEARVSLRLEAADGTPLPLLRPSGEHHDDRSFVVDLEAAEAGKAGRGWHGALPPHFDWVVPEGFPAGICYLKAEIASAEGEVLSTNSYEFYVPDTTFSDLAARTKADVRMLLDGLPRSAGFHYWQGGQVVYRARPGLRGFLVGYGTARERGIDLEETVQGEHLFRHLLAELPQIPHGERLADEIWRIRSEVLSPQVKARALLRYVQLFVQRAEERLAQTNPASRTGRRRERVPGLPGPNAVSGLRGPNAVSGLRGPNAVPGLRDPNAVPGLRDPNAVPRPRAPNAITALRSSRSRIHLAVGRDLVAYPAPAVPDGEAEVDVIGGTPRPEEEPL